MHHHNGLKGDVFLGYSVSIWYHLTGWRGLWEALELFLTGSTGVGGREQRQKTLEALGPVWLVAGAMGSKGTEER